jgi:hypothetical protein
MSAIGSVNANKDYKVRRCLYSNGRLGHGRKDRLNGDKRTIYRMKREPKKTFDTKITIEKLSKASPLCEEEAKVEIGEKRTATEGDRSTARRKLMEIISYFI